MPDEILQQEIEALKVLLDHEGYDYQDGAEADVLSSVERSVSLPEVYREFLEQLNPGDSVWRIGGQIAVRLYSADELPEFQADARHPAQFIFGTLNDHPLSLEKHAKDALEASVFRLDEDGEEICVASSFTQFLKILRTGMDMLSSLSEFDADAEIEPDESYDDLNDFEESAFERGREEVLSDYLEELETIDPDCAEAWIPA